MTKRPKKTEKPATHPDLLACMDYLHGDVVGEEFEAAGHYEYGRESAVLREAARLRASELNRREIAVKVEEEIECGYWFLQPDWSFIWNCSSFPEKSWNQLPESERAYILRVFPPPASKVQPLRLSEVWNLDANGIFDEFKAMAVKQMQDETTLSGKAPEKVYPIIEGWPMQKEGSSRWVHALFSLDFTKGKKRLLQEFDKWLQLPENEKRFKDHRRNPVGKTGVFKDRLKDLASWRLYRELGCDKALQFAADNRLRDSADRPRPFHDQRKDQLGKVPRNEMPLYSEESAFLKAKAKAERFREELFPCEFGRFAKEWEREKEESRERWAKIFAKIAPQISKSSS